MRGKKPFSDAEARLRGTNRRGRRPKAAPAPIIGDAGACPPELDDDGREAWGELVDVMTKAGTVSPKYRAAIAGAALTSQNIRRCQLDIARHGATYKANGLRKMNPSVRESRDWLALRLRYLVELGLTPVSNRRVAAEKADQEEAVYDEFFGPRLATG